MRRLVSLLAMFFLGGACHSPVPAAPATIAASPPQAPSTSPAGSAAPPAPPAWVVRPDPPPPLADDLRGLAASNNAFGLDLFAKIRSQKGNLAISPLSLSTALTMTWAGARGETAEQMKKVLHQTGTIEQALFLNSKLLASYQEPDVKVTLYVANRLFGEKTYTFEPSYLSLTKTTFGASLEPVDFRNEFDASRQHINAWIASTTHERIKDLLPPKGVDDHTRLVLANAIYFLGGWSSRFSEQSTVGASFHFTPSSSHDVPTMHQAGQFRFAATDGVKLLEMFYEGRALAMTLVLPDQQGGLDAVEARLSPATLDAWFGALASLSVDVVLPKFQIDPASSLALRNTLEALGMPLAFTPKKADFTGITNPPVALDRLYMDDVFHKTFIRIDEKGTEATAATVVVMRNHKRSRPSPPKMEFHADHPFLFFLRDVRSGMILFMGRVSDPTAK
jgi:serpin B